MLLELARTARSSPLVGVDSNMFEEPFVTFTGSPELLNLVGATVVVDSNDFIGIHHAGRALAEDFGRVTRGNSSPFQLVDAQPSLNGIQSAIIIGSLSSTLIRGLETAGKIDTRAIHGKWETFITAVVDSPLDGCTKALVIAGSDKRAAIYGAYTLSSQIGVSPYATILQTSHSMLTIIDGTGGPTSQLTSTQRSTHCLSRHPAVNRAYNIAAYSSMTKHRR